MSANAGQLISNEQVVYSTRKHWAAVLVDSIWAILFIIGALVLSWLEGDTTSGIVGVLNRIIDMLRLAAFLIGFGWIAYNIVAWRTAEYVVSNLRVFGHEGLLRRRESETLLASITDIETSQGLLGRTLGYGNIRIISAAGRPGTDTFTAVQRPDGFKRNILEQKAARTIANGSVGTAEERAEAFQVLGQLASLRDAGAITQAEYEAKRASWVAKI
ncbi:MAG: PH domain-containing protein [Chloroflexi bacterium]|nr:PH domain-containing protein [Chloroflexota bacterium]